MMYFALDGRVTYGNWTVKEGCLLQKIAIVSLMSWELWVVYSGI